MTSPVSLNTDKTSVLADYVYNLLTSERYELGLEQVLYGKHNMVPKNNTVRVIPGRKTRVLKGVSAPGGRVENILVVLIDVMTSDPLIGESEGRLMTDQLADTVEHFLHQDTTMGGLIIHGFVDTWDPGEEFINNSMFRVVRLTFTGQSRTYLSAP
jgi:hypothetical protein